MVVLWLLPVTSGRVSRAWVGLPQRRSLTRACEPGLPCVSCMSAGPLGQGAEACLMGASWEPQCFEGLRGWSGGHNHWCSPFLALPGLLLSSGIFLPPQLPASSSAAAPPQF